MSDMDVKNRKVLIILVNENGLIWLTSISLDIIDSFIDKNERIVYYV